VNRINSYLENFGQVFPYRKNLRLFQRLLLVFLCFNALFFYRPSASYLFGPDSPFANYYRSSNPILYVINLLEDPAIGRYWYIFFYGQIMSCLVLLWKPNVRWLWLILYWTTAVLYNRTAPIQNAGMNLVVILLLLMIFAEPGKEEKRGDSRGQFLLNTMHRLAFMAMKFQVVLLYLVASVIKLTGQTWVDGTAWYYVLFNETYSNGFWQKYFLGNDWLQKIVTWFTLIFQLSFPVFIWFKQFKYPLLLAGILFHVMIGISMGIIDFGLIMIVVYTLFLDEEKVNRLTTFYTILTKKSKAEV
jgi:hypothetical protein